MSSGHREKFPQRCRHDLGGVRARQLPPPVNVGDPIGTFVTKLARSFTGAQASGFYISWCCVGDVRAGT